LIDFCGHCQVLLPSVLFTACFPLNWPGIKKLYGPCCRSGARGILGLMYWLYFFPPNKLYNADLDIANEKVQLCNPWNQLVFHAWENGTVVFRRSWEFIWFDSPRLGLGGISAQQCFLSTSCVPGTVLGTCEQTGICLRGRGMALLQSPVPEKIN
jgi:hypothetical protein